jgi:hypothetical protein
LLLMILNGLLAIINKFHMLMVYIMKVHICNISLMKIYMDNSLMIYKRCVILFMINIMKTKIISVSYH